MAITYSTNLKLTLIGTGDQAGTWGNTTNTNLGTLIEQAIAGYVSQTVADSATSTSLSIADGTSSVARNMVLVLQGALTLARDIILPTSTKLYFIHNNTSGGFAVTAKCSGQTGVSIPNGAKVILACNGTDIVEAFNYSGSLIFPTSATITTLSGTTLGYGSASITNASIASGTVTNLRATTFQGGSASITNADIDSAVIGILTNTTFSSGSASITTASFGSATVTNLLATTFSGGSASITTVTGTTFGTTGASQIRGASGAIGQLTVTSATITNLNVTSLTTGNFPLPTSATIATLSGTTLGYASASITTASIASGTITNLLATTFSGGSASITTVTGTTFGTTGTTQLRGASAAITHLFATSATITTLTSTSAGITTLSSTTFSGGSASITTVTGTTFGTTGTTQLRGASAAITHLFATSATISTLTSTSASITNVSIGSGVVSGNFNAATASGNVGIGTTSPVSKLDVNGDVNTAQNSFISSNLYFSGGWKYKENGYGGFLKLAESAGGVSLYTSGLNSSGSGASATVILAISVATNGSVTAPVDMRSPIFYDSANTAYYLDPANTGTSMVVAGDVVASNLKTSANTALSLGLYTGTAFNTGGAAISLRGSTTGYNDSGMEFYAGNSERMRINSSGNVGVGTSSPSSRLEASGANCVVKSSATSGYAGFYAIGSGTNNSYLFLGNTTSGEQGRITSENGGGLVFSNGSGATERMRLDSAGNVGIGVVSPTVKLDVAGSILASGNVTAYSDIRVKDNVENIEGAIGKLNQIRGVTYTRTDLDDKQRRFAGVIAQEIEQVLPEAVFDNGKVKAVDYNATIALLIEAVKEQQGQINELKLTIEQLKGN